jgi:hypothetical protein
LRGVEAGYNNGRRVSFVWSLSAMAFSLLQA